MQTLQWTTRVSEQPPCGAGGCDWTELLQRSATRTVFQTQAWQQAWWQAYGRGERLYVTVERGGRPHALAPLFVTERMAFFIGSGGSDYLDFLGETGDPEVVVAILAAVRAAIPGFVGCHFYHVPDDSPTGMRLKAAAETLGWDCYDEGAQTAPTLRVAGARDVAEAAAGKKSLVRHERFFRREGTLDVTHLRWGEAIRPHLEDFFHQHRARWATTPWPSLFNEEAHCRFYYRLTEQAGADWLRFTRVDWNGQPIAFHFGFSYEGTFLWYKPSFAIEWARHSPGEVLLRQLLLAALAEGADWFDFGLGDEAFKQRFATTTRSVRNWGVYPR